MILYKNGVSVETVDSQGTVSPSSSSILFGQEGNNSAYYTGLLDDIHIWNTALTQSQIQQFTNCPPMGTETGLIGYWNFEEGIGVTADDLTSNGNMGVLSGPTWSNDVPAYNCNVGISELSSQPKNLIQILDMMGRETSFKPNTPLIYVYDDGSTEKVFSVEY